MFLCRWFTTNFLIAKISIIVVLYGSSKCIIFCFDENHWNRFEGQNPLNLNLKKKTSPIHNHHIRYGSLYIYIFILYLSVWNAWPKPVYHFHIQFSYFDALRPILVGKLKESVVQLPLNILRFVFIFVHLAISAAQPYLQSMDQQKTRENCTC